MFKLNSFISNTKKSDIIKKKIKLLIFYGINR